MSIVTVLSSPAAAHAFRRAMTAIVLLGLLVTAVTARGEPSDADFLAAKRAYERGERTTLASFAPLFSGHLLEPYVAYWQLKLALDTAARDDVRAYWERWPDTPLADRLRVEWLKTLGNRADWATFALDYPPPSGEDTELACYGIQYARARDGESALDAAKPLWFTGQQTPDACEPLFAALIRSNRISVADRHARFRLAVEAGSFRLAQAIADDLPPPDRIVPRDFARVDRDPAKALALGDFAWNRASGRDLALYALERAARADPTAARAAWVRQRPRLPEVDRGYGNARLAFHAARQLLPQANDWYRETSGAPLSDVQHAWRVRAALRAGAWPDVLAGIDAMPAPQAQEAAWRYWRGRALAAAGRKDEALAIYSALAIEPNFYGLLASEALGTTVSAAPAAETPSEGPASSAALAAFGAKPAVRRAVALANLSLKPESLREWIYAIRGLDDEGLLVASEYARRQKLYDRAINTAERTASRHDFTLRYLMPYREHFAAAARETETDEAMLLGIARQESRFSTDIVSSAGAVGLMQLMPATARWVARQQGRGDYRPSDIGDAATNTQFGAYYLRYCLERLERLPALAFAAYNAGPNRAQAWRVGTPLEGAIWVETIPFNETRDYVKKVLANTMFYARALKQPYVPLSRRLGTITPRGESAAADAGARSD
jgi:soluble lytic murein transglycosylase